MRDFIIELSKSIKPCALLTPIPAAAALIAINDCPNLSTSTPASCIDCLASDKDVLSLPIPVLASCIAVFALSCAVFSLVNCASAFFKAICLLAIALSFLTSLEVNFSKSARKMLTLSP